MSVVGFDLGYQSCHVAIVRHGGVEVVVNEYSDRKSMSLVAFSQARRLMGQSAKNQHIMNYKNTIYGFRELLGRKFSDPCIQQQITNLPFAVVCLKDDSIGIKINNGDGEKVFSPEQVTAMMLTYLKKIAEKALEKPVVDCVISVPSFFTDAQRRALLDASFIAGLNCLRLFNDTTAAALAYGIYKQDLPAETEKPRNVVFVDIGYSSLQVVVCSFQKGKLNVIAKTFDTSLGGRNFDFRLVEYFVAEFKKKNMDIHGKHKQLIRLVGEVEKLKKMMSSVTTPIPLNIECFYEDRDVSSSIKREIFEDLCSDLFIRVKQILSSSLTKSKLSVGEIDAVEVVGGSCRIPGIKDAIISVFKSELSTTLNLDEAVCRGCALQCAMLSPTFKVRDFNVNDIQPYPIQLKWQAPLKGDSGDMMVYREGDLIFHSKMLTFYRKEPFQLEASYLSSKGMSYCSNPHIGTFTIKNISPTEEGEASKIKVKVRLNIHGIFFVKDATLVEKQKVEAAPEVPEAMEMDNVPADVQLPEVDKMADKTSQNAVPDNEVPAEEKLLNDDPAQDDESMVEGTTASGEERLPGNSLEDDKEKDMSAAKPPEVKKQKKPTVKYIDLPILTQAGSMTRKALDTAHEIEVNLNYQDQLEQEKVDARNAVEEYVYSMRDKLYNLTEFVSEQDKESFSQLLMATEDWLYGEGEDQPKKVYIEHLTMLRKSGDPILMRERECKEIPLAFNDLGKKVVHYEKIINSYDQGEELYAHLAIEEMDKVREQVKGKREWLEIHMQACQTTLKHVTAPISSIQIRAEAKNLQVATDPIVNKPKPKVEPPKDDQSNLESTVNSEENIMDDDSKSSELNSDKQPPPSSDNMDLD